VWCVYLIAAGNILETSFNVTFVDLRDPTFADVHQTIHATAAAHASTHEVDKAAHQTEGHGHRKPLFHDLHVGPSFLVYHRNELAWVDLIQGDATRYMVKKEVVVVVVVGGGRANTSTLASKAKRSCTTTLQQS
jgi:hypothetical protein